MSLLDTIMQQIGGEKLSQISGQLGADEATTKSAVGAALPTLLGAISKNASSREGAESLHRAVEKDHDGGILDNLGGFLQSPESGEGDGILGHVLGRKRGTVESGISRATGLESSSTSKLMAMLAPVVMGAVGKEQRSKGLDAGALAGMLNRERETAERQAPKEMGLVAKLLDSDDDGDLDIGDFVKQGSGLLGKLFNR